MAAKEIPESEVYEVLRTGGYGMCDRHSRAVTLLIRGNVFDVLFALQGGEVVIVFTTFNAKIP